MKISSGHKFHNNSHSRTHYLLISQAHSSSAIFTIDLNICLSSYLYLPLFPPTYFLSYLITFAFRETWDSFILCQIRPCSVSDEWNGVMPGCLRLFTIVSSPILASTTTLLSHITTTTRTVTLYLYFPSIHLCIFLRLLPNIQNVLCPLPRSIKSQYTDFHMHWEKETNRQTEK